MYDNRFMENTNHYLNDRLKNLESSVGNMNPMYKSKEQQEMEQLKKENDMLKQRLQIAQDPIRSEFEQSEEFRNAWLTNIVSFLYETNMAQWAQSPYAQKLDEWTNKRVEEIKKNRVALTQNPQALKTNQYNQAQGGGNNV